MAKKRIGSSLLLSFLMLSGSFAGTLSDFEDAVTTPSEKSSPPSSHHQRHHDFDEHDDEQSLGGFLLELAVVGTYHGAKWLVYDWWAHPDQPERGQSSLYDDGEFRGGSGQIRDYSCEPYSTAHELGEPYLPFLRFDYRQQYIDHDLSAHDFLLEAGYEHLALLGRFTRYEDELGERLDTEQYYGLLRFGEKGADIPGAVELDLGVGGYVIKGNETHGGFALTTPIKYYPSEWCGFEFRPAWANVAEKTISDYDLSASVGADFFQLRLGYRWLWVRGEGHWLNGPYAGLSISF